MYVGPSESVLPRNRAGYRVGGIGHMRGGSYPPKPLRKKLERCSQLDALGSHCTRRPCLNALSDFQSVSLQCRSNEMGYWADSIPDVPRRESQCGPSDE